MSSSLSSDDTSSLLLSAHIITRISFMTRHFITSSPLCPMGDIGRAQLLPFLSTLSRSFGFAPGHVDLLQVVLYASAPCSSGPATFPCSLWIPIHRMAHNVSLTSPAYSGAVVAVVIFVDVFVTN